MTTPNQTPATRHQFLRENLFSVGNEKVGSSVFLFNLPAGESCPGKSLACEMFCYAKTGYFGFHRDQYDENLRLARRSDFVGRAVRELHHREARLVRLHSSGDFFDPIYANKWQQIARALPEVTFWAYTRSWRVQELRCELESLAALPNFNLWFSADVTTGLPPAMRGVRACWMQVRDEPFPRAKRSQLPIELIFTVKQEDRVRQKWIDGALICPTYNGTLAGSEATCETCKFCWSRSGSKSDLVQIAPQQTSATCVIDSDKGEGK